MSVTYIQVKLNNLTAWADEDGDDGSDSDEFDGPNTAQDQVLIEPLFDAGNSEVLKMLRDLLSERSVAGMSQPALKLAELLELGKREQGSVFLAASHKSLQDRWFGSKGKKKGEVQDNILHNDVWIERDTLVKLKRTKGGQEIEHCYNVLGIC